MAMLAQPRQRRRYNLAPKGKALYEDENRFGTKMLEKMGWKKGQGLGANESGMKDFVRIRYKNDAFGLGFESRDDQWTQHEQNFNGLLIALNKERNCNDLNMANEKDESENVISRAGCGFPGEGSTKPSCGKIREKLSGISLEERSKQSRARVHYKKFTKGKDIAQYTEKDLSNIFGKKGIQEQITCNDIYQHLNNNYGIIEERSQSILFTSTEVTNCKIKEPHIQDSGYICSGKSEENFHNESKDQNKKEEKVKKIEIESVQDSNPKIIYSNISMNDYFKMKMYNMKHADNYLNNNGENVNANDRNEVKNTVVEKRKENILDRYHEDGDIYMVNDIDIKNKEINNFDGVVPVEFSINLTNQKKKTKKLQSCRSIDNSALKIKGVDLLSKSFTISNAAETLDEINKTEKQSKNEKNLLKNTSEIYKSESCKRKKRLSQLKEKGETIDISVVNQLKHYSQPKSENIGNSARNALVNDHFQILGTEEVKERYKAFNVYVISSFCAEKFRNINFNEFVGSTLPLIEGYGISQDLQLDVKVIPNDEERITKLWRGLLNKYAEFGKPKKIYRQYLKKVISARKTKQKRPKLYVKAWKRKNTFQAI